MMFTPKGGFAKYLCIGQKGRDLSSIVSMCQSHTYFRSANIGT